MSEKEEIFYLVSYDKESGLWRSADEMLGHLVRNATDFDGPVHFLNDEGEPEWRQLKGNDEQDIDFDNAQALGGFLRGLNESKLT